MQREFKEKNNQIKRENEEISRNLLLLKEKMTNFRNKQKRKLVSLAINSKEIMDNF